jgi:hypothetical protein
MRQRGAAQAKRLEGSTTATRSWLGASVVMACLQKIEVSYHPSQRTEITGKN